MHVKLELGSTWKLSSKKGLLDLHVLPWHCSLANFPARCAPACTT